MAETPQKPGAPKVTLDDLIDRAKSAAELTAIGEKYPKAKAQVDVQAQMDASLARLFAAPDIKAPKAPAEASQAAGPIRWFPWAAAAALLLAGVGVWWFVFRGGPDVLAPAYHQIVAAGFKPESVCTTDEEFAAWCKAYLKQPIVPTSHPDGLQYVGWSQEKIISKKSSILLATAKGDRVIVVMERRDRQTISPGPSVDPSLHVFSKRIGDVMLYEVTPKGEAAVLPTLGAPTKR